MIKNTNSKQKIYDFEERTFQFTKKVRGYWNFNN